MPTNPAPGGLIGDRTKGGELEGGGTPDTVAGALEDAKHQSLFRGLGGVRDTWQTAYTAFDQAISNAEIVSTTAVIN